MPLISLSTALSANATVDNVIAGSQFEFLPYDAQLEFGIVGNGTLGDILVDVYSGQDVLMEAGVISILARTPVYPEDYTLIDVAAGGERIKIRLRNTTGGALVVNTAVRITPI